MAGVGPGETTARFGARVPEVLLAAAAAVVLVNLVTHATTGRGDPYLTATHVVTLTAAALVRYRRPDLPASAWYAALAVLAAAAGWADGTLAWLYAQDASPVSLSRANVVSTEVGLAGTLVTVLLIGSFPDGRLETPRQRRVVAATGLALLVPLGVILSSATIPLPRYLDAAPVANPWLVTPVALPGGAAEGVIGLTFMVVLTGPVLLLLRYRHAAEGTRRRMRWLLLPILLVVLSGVTNVVVTESSRLATWVLLVVMSVSGDVAATFGILAPERVDADRAIRRTLVFGVLWLLIAGAYVATAAAVGVTAGHALPLRWAVVMACLAALLFQPARTWLQRTADRWVFGRRPDPALVIARLGDTLAGTFDLAHLLPLMADALEQGLGLQWARVRADEGSGEGEVAVPVVLDGEVVGVVECGPKRHGPWTEEDLAVVTTFAAQAALAVHNVRLTEHLAARAAEVAASRTRLVQAQERERRRIERNIHDGVQQDLVALIGLTGLTRRRIERGGRLDPRTLGAELDDLQTGMQRLLADLRELAAGVHPSVLTDHGLPAAVEALVTRHPVPARLTIDPALRSGRLSEELEGAVYFTVAEALANSLKHARATALEVELARLNGSLLAMVRDDGAGFVTPPPEGGGLDRLAERARALDGELSVTSAPDAGTRVMARFSVDTAGETR